MARGVASIDNARRGKQWLKTPHTVKAGTVKKRDVLHWRHLRRLAALRSEGSAMSVPPGVVAMHLRLYERYVALLIDSLPNVEPLADYCDRIERLLGLAEYFYETTDDEKPEPVAAAQDDAGSLGATPASSAKAPNGAGSLYQRRDGRFVAAVQENGVRRAAYGHTPEEAATKLEADRPAEVPSSDSSPSDEAAEMEPPAKPKRQYSEQALANLRANLARAREARSGSAAIPPEPYEPEVIAEPEPLFPKPPVFENKQTVVFAEESKPACTCPEWWTKRANRHNAYVRNEAHIEACAMYRKGAHYFPIPSTSDGNGKYVSRCVWCSEEKAFEPYGEENTPTPIAPKTNVCPNCGGHRASQLHKTACLQRPVPA